MNFESFFASYSTFSYSSANLMCIQILLPYLTPIMFCLFRTILRLWSICVCRKTCTLMIHLIKYSCVFLLQEFHPDYYYSATNLLFLSFFILQIINQQKPLEIGNEFLACVIFCFLFQIFLYLFYLPTMKKRTGIHNRNHAMNFANWCLLK